MKNENEDYRNYFLKLGLIYQKRLEIERNSNNKYAQNFYKLFIRSHPNYNDYLVLIGERKFKQEIEKYTNNFDSTCYYNKHISDAIYLFEIKNKKKNILRWDERWVPDYEHNKEVREQIARIESEEN